jgi:hypothetical protein
MAQVALSILKPAGSVGVIVQLVSTLLELLKVILGTPTEVKDTTLYTVTAKSASNNTDVAIFPLTVYALTPNITHAVGQVAITGDYCVYSSSFHLSWDTTDGTSCTVNTQASW